jgi:UDP-N-acetylglucosamine 4,6-dehydratase/UDP-glucose 4-epimerase
MNILITGATGFLGVALLERLHKTNDHSSIKVLSRNEGKLISLKQKYPDIKIITGDVSDDCTVEYACKGVDVLFHLAAFKHVGLAERMAYQCAMSNISGTVNLLKHFKGHTFVAISTDKVAKISGVYGASKYIMERLIKQWSEIDNAVRYIVPRYGNVIGSTGSVIPKWISICKDGGEMVVTDPEATRFFFTVDDAVDLIFEAMENAESGDPYIKKMKSCHVGELARAIREKYGRPDNYKIIGLQPGENMHEYLSDDYCSADAPKYSFEEITKMI